MKKLLMAVAIALIGLAVLLVPARPAQGYIEVAYTLGKVVGDSTNIVLMQVESVDKVKNTITFKKIEDLKGKHPTDIIKHNIAQAGFAPREWQNVMAWAEPGQFAIMFHNGSASETCINNYWYQCYPGGEWWNMFHGEPYLLRSYSGKPEKLVPLIKQMLEGKEVVITAMVDGDKDALHMRTARVQRLKASLKIQEYDAKRDFVGWGGDEIKAIGSMPGFSYYSAFTRTSAGGGRGGEGALTLDFDLDGKPDFVLYGENRAALYLGDGTSTNEIVLPLPEGARGAAAGILRDGKLQDLVFATASGPKLITNLGAGAVRDDSAALPQQRYCNTTAVAILDADGDGRQDILVADGFSGLHLYRNVTPHGVWKDAPRFEEVSEKFGLGSAGIGAGSKGSTLLVADVNGDGRPDVLFIAETPKLLINTGKGFVLSTDSGLNFKAAAGRPAFGEIGGVLHLAVGGIGKVQLYRCDGKGHFTQVSGLPAFSGEATSVAFADFNATGKTDLLVGVVRGPNRYLRNKGDGTFEDASDKMGLSQKIFNTRALAVLDLNKDGTPDLLLNNDGQEPVLLFGNPARKGAK